MWAEKNYRASRRRATLGPVALPSRQSSQCGSFLDHAVVAVRYKALFFEIPT